MKLLDRQSMQKRGGGKHISVSVDRYTIFGEDI
jgi:hypothetical protein